MARVLGVHEVELTPGTDPDEFEQAAAAVVALTAPEGWRARVLKGERGPRTGKYLIVFEIDSLEARNRFYPQEGHESTEEGARFDQEHPEAAAAWGRLDGMIEDLDAATDYVEITD